MEIKIKWIPRKQMTHENTYRDDKFQSPVIKLQDGVINVKVIDIFCFKFLQKTCMNFFLTISTEYSVTTQI